MAKERSILYQPETWGAVAPRLFAMSDHELRDLAARAGAEPADSREELLDNILDRGGFLLVEFGLTGDPKMMRGTVFSEDIHEYVLFDDAAAQLAEGEDVTIRYVGGDFAGIFTTKEVIEALKSSDSFDQLERE